MINEGSADGTENIGRVERESGRWGQISGLSLPICFFPISYLEKFYIPH